MYMSCCTFPNLIRNYLHVHVLMKYIYTEIMVVKPKAVKIETEDLTNELFPVMPVMV